MRSFWALAPAAVFVLGTLLAGSASAMTTLAPVDTCTVSGSGTVYTLRITIPAGVEQFGFAFGAQGTNVTNAVIPGSNGSFSTQHLASNTAGAWISDSPLPSAPVVTLTTGGVATGSFTIVPATTSQPVYTTAVTCVQSTTVPGRNVAFTVERHATYSSAGRSWELAVTIPTAGTISAKQPEPTLSTGGATQGTVKPFVQAKRIVTKFPGTFTLRLKPTSRGQTQLNENRSITLSLDVTFDSNDGKSSSTLVSLTLAK